MNEEEIAMQNLIDEDNIDFEIIDNWNKEEMKFDHFKNVEELLEHIKIWYTEDEVFYERWFGLNDLYKLGQYIETLQSQLDIANKKLDKKKEYLVQVYDEDGNACKNPRYFKGTEEEVEQYIQDRFGIVDAVYGRTTRYYETTNEEDIPNKIEVE